MEQHMHGSHAADRTTSQHCLEWGMWPASTFTTLLTNLEWGMWPASTFTTLLTNPEPFLHLNKIV